MTTPYVVPGEVVTGAGEVKLNPGRPRVTVIVLNTGDRPVQVGSHYHFAVCNPALDFDREAAWGTRLDIPAGTAVRFEPGIPREVALVPLSGLRLVPGLRLDSALGEDPGDESARGNNTDGGSTRGESAPGAGAGGA